MTAFESRGAELQMDSASGFQARKRFENSCKLCCNRGLRIECDRCGIRVAHETFMDILREMGVRPRSQVQVGFGC